MPLSRPSNIYVQNSFSKGLITEATGLTFPENAATDTDNCVFSRLGRVSRRLGFDYETNKTLTTIDRSLKAISTFKWDNAGGDGNTKVLAVQVGATLHFYRSSSATTSSPLSANKLASTIDISAFVATGGTYDATVECQYSTGNGYLFVYHPTCDPFFCTYASGTITASVISVSIRDFTGIPDNLADSFRPPTLSSEHDYNIRNQGWTSAPGWTATSTTSNNTATGSHTWTVQTGLTISAGQGVNITGIYTSGGAHATAYEGGTVTSYTSGTGVLIINVTSSNLVPYTITSWTLERPASSYPTTFQSVAGVYPSNSDVWWRFKNSSDVFDVTTTLTNVTLDLYPAPKGHYVLPAFYQNRTTISGVASITDTTTTTRPRTGAWFAGRVWYTGVDAAFAATGDAPYTTWTENIYFSQIVERTEQISRCYQVNDPTSEETFDLLPNDGGVIRIQGCGSIFKLFPIQNGMLVFAANGIWFITGSQGIGFSANDYTITKLSSIQSISSTSFVDVNGYPMWWNEEGIYAVVPGQQGLDVQPMTLTTISTFYEDIPLTSKKYAKGAYNPLTYTVQWLYRTTEETNVTTRHSYDGVLNFNQTIQAFYPWSISSSTGSPKVCAVDYIAGPGGSTTPDPTFKYLTFTVNGASYDSTFSEEFDTRHVDWHAYDTAGTDYNSYFMTGYILHGQASRKFQQNYITVFSDASEDTSFKIQAMWDFAVLANSGQWSTSQVFYPQTASSNADVNYAYVAKRIKLRGRGRACQFRIFNNGSEPFSIIGWSVFETASRSI